MPSSSRYRWLAGSNALHQGKYRLIDHGNEDSIGDKTWEVLHLHGRFSECGRQFHDFSEVASDVPSLE